MVFYNQKFRILSLIKSLMPKLQNFQTDNLRLSKRLDGEVKAKFFEAEVKEWKKKFPNKVAIKKQHMLNQKEKNIIEAIMKYQEQHELKESNKQPSTQLVKIYDIIQMNSESAFVMELGENNLLFYLKNNKPSLKKILQINQLSQSIRFIHQDLKSMHRDIKPENFIYIGDQFKLIDFGTVRYNTNIDKTIQIGTTLYQAPEMVNGQSNHTEAIDIWSLGCVFYEFFGPEPLFYGKIQTAVKNDIQSIITNQKDLKEKINSNKGG
ncbi:unnamed protein product (macronuclear) [Paramecium tetraurelia]|uniref:Protein kinase domain-containing protein n=1 Tax=Paramecium tetraurelia TaxID=5888 RepID=A0CQX6_PARTE|nr:uncharacterized protein GSPATT00038849001 [Paramecium tetraurelia]CAK73193.1 unnamed protein product [Paramecium tetraurelia]|eukprot:XP_001440590.1 hypothetical protein (macronuclear) [Paramecium tetraurelia strain d4-2]